MTGIEIVLVVIGIIMVIASFFIMEKLSNKELDKISELSTEEMRCILERNLKVAQQKVNEMIDSIIEKSMDESMEKVERGLDKEANEKIQAISEYSDTVLETIHKTHNEVMFLYSMLNDKHSELTTYASKLASLAGALEELQQKIEDTVENSDEIIQQIQEKNAKSAQILNEESFMETLPELEILDEPTDSSDKKQIILSMYKEGQTVIEIAKQLGMGVGEVKLIIGLFREEEI
ncbi:MAG: DUF6115 domain-containing protein [Lachnospiraceae bacterium]